MQRQITISPFRELLFDIRDALTAEEFKILIDASKDKLPVWKWESLPNGEIKQDRNLLFMALEENGALSKNNLKFLLSSLKKLKRNDLVELVNDFQKSKVKCSPRPTQYTKVCDDIINGLREDEYIKLKELCKDKIKKDDWQNLRDLDACTDRNAKKVHLFVALEKSCSLGPDNLTYLNKSLEKIGRKDLSLKLKELEKKANHISVFDWRIMVPSGVVLAIAFYQLLFPGLTYLRTWWCCYGAIEPLHIMEFDFTTIDYQNPHVIGVEYEWSVLKEKLHLDFDKHPSSDMHYFLNLDRCGAGGVRYVRNWFFNLPQVRGAEVFAVNKECKMVFFHHNNMWNTYRSARNIQCPTNILH